MKMCRVCLVTENEMIPLDDAFVFNYNLLTNLNVMLCDDLPQSSCQGCAEALKFFIEFRKKAIASETTLKSIAENVKQDPDALESEYEEKLDCKTDEYEEKTDCKKELSDNEEIKIEMNNTDDNFNYEFEEEYHFESNESDLSKEPKNRTKKNCYKKKVKQSETKTKKGRKKKIREIVDDSFLCGICTKKFEEVNAMNTHLDTHKSNRQCGVCQEYFKSWQQLFAHRVQHLPINKRRCHICNKRYIKNYSMEYHYLKMHSDGQEVSLECEQCNKVFVCPIKLKKHMYDSHNSKSTYICDFCSKRCNSKSKIRTHIISHLNIKPFSCHVCGYRSKTTCNLKDHIIRKHTPDKVYCPRCLRVFENQKMHDKHKCVSKIQICPICGKEVDTKHGRMNRHLKTHEPVGQFKCDRCPSTYRTKAALFVHVSRHDGVRPFKCEYCPARFYSSTSRLKHHRIHTGEKPYVCNICSRGFTSNSNLKTHMKVHGLFLINHKNKDVVNTPDVK